MNILIIEDDEELLKNLKRSLEEERYRVETATDGRTGLEKIGSRSSRSYSTGILMLPQMNGLEVLKEIREMGNNTPVMMLTARGDIQDKIEGLDFGADDYLAKPFSTTGTICTYARHSASKH